MKSILLIFVFCALSIPSVTFATALSDAANATQPGTWRELVTNNVNILGSNGSSNLPFTDDLTYDPNSKRLYYIGGDHCTPSRFISYDEATNAWQVMPHPGWLTSSSDYCNGVLHGYDNGAVDQAKGYFYHARSARLNRYNTATQTWSATPDLPSADPHGGYNGVEVFPELGGVAYVDGANGFPAKVYLYKETTNAWTTLASGLVAGSTYQYAEYNPVHKVMVFTVNNKFYKLSSAGQVTPLATTPFPLYSGSGYVSVLTVDPVSGLYLVLAAENRTFYTYNYLTDTWQQKSSPTKPSMSGNGVVATPLSNYGVTLFTACTSTCHVYLYKSGSTDVESSKVTGNVGLEISPNPIRGNATIRIPEGLENGAAEAALYSAAGKRVWVSRTDGGSLSDGLTVDASRLPAGLYLCRVRSGGVSLVKKVLVED